ncbi:MAG: hypothetical protein J6Y02_16460 [Pseudobutyrivibrio sp.]|nr:hypothetical protein [Pseudobutyrivibrio sp.]
MLTTYQILSLLGCSSIMSAIFGALITRVISYRKENHALKKGIQALLRAQMINDYNKWTTKKYAPIYARENFENCWKQYEILGENGVMTDIHNKFMALPTNPPEEVNNNEKS